MDLNTYVSDNLIKLLGASQPTIVDFVVATAKSAKSSSALLDKLSTVLDSEDADLQRFSDNLYKRVARGSSNGASAPRREKAEPKKEGRKKYALIDMEVEDEVPAPKPKAKETNGESKSERRERWRDEKERRRSRSRDHHERKMKKRERGNDDFEDRWGDEEVQEEASTLR